MKVGTLCKIELKSLRPTQSVLGMLEVKDKIKKLKEMSKDDLKAYLDDHVAPVVIGPDAEPYIIDHHHLGYALLISKTRDEIHTEIVANWKELSPEDFWTLMQKKNWTYLNGKKPTHLPKSLHDLEDDPYRSLAWLARESKGFEKVKVPFSEFKWADFFRTHIPIDPNDRHLEKALQHALELSRSAKAKDLPGFLPDILRD